MATKIVSVPAIAKKIHFLRGQRVLLDSDLAALYGVKTKALNQAVKRNATRFPDDFMFKLSGEEALRVSQSVTPSFDSPQDAISPRSRSQIVTLKRGRNIKYIPYVFTEQGVVMLSSNHPN
jgi:ORF6N domain